MNRLRTPGWLTVAAVCAAITLAGCGSQVAGRTAGHAQTASTTSHAASPRQRAAADAARIIADFRRPPGAVRTDPIASLTSPAVGIGIADVATATRWWRVPGQPRDVLSWVRAHLPAGYTPAGSGSATFRNS